QPQCKYVVNSNRVCRPSGAIRIVIVFQRLAPLAKLYRPCRGSQAATPLPRSSSWHWFLHHSCVLDSFKLTPGPLRRPGRFVLADFSKTYHRERLMRCLTQGERLTYVKTKIVSTVGPACSTLEMLTELVLAGTD